jgi:hypothetical protein
MTDEQRPSSDRAHHPHEQRLEEELVHVHVKEEELERELAKLQEREEKIEHDLEDERHRSNRDRFFLVFIVNGEDFKIEIDPNDLLRIAVEKALSESGNTGRQDPAEWEVRDSAGVLLEMARKIKDLGLADGARLFLSLKVGAGGNNAIRP